MNVDQGMESPISSLPDARASTRSLISKSFPHRERTFRLPLNSQVIPNPINPLHVVDDITKPGVRDGEVESDREFAIPSSLRPPSNKPTSRRTPFRVFAIHQNSSLVNFRSEISQILLTTQGQVPDESKATEKSNSWTEHLNPQSERGVCLGLKSWMDVEKGVGMRARPPMRRKMETDMADVGGLGDPCEPSIQHRTESSRGQYTRAVNGRSIRHHKN